LRTRTGLHPLSGDDSPLQQQTLPAGSDAFVREAVARLMRAVRASAVLAPANAGAGTGSELQGVTNRPARRGNWKQLRRLGRRRSSAGARFRDHEARRCAWRSTPDPREHLSGLRKRAWRGRVIGKSCGCPEGTDAGGSAGTVYVSGKDRGFAQTGFNRTFYYLFATGEQVGSRW
jgi:hypothetical protein